jgi:hypothetical protein
MLMIIPERYARNAGRNALISAAMLKTLVWYCRWTCSMLERSHLVMASVVHQGIHPAELLDGEPGEGDRRRLVIDIQQDGIHAAQPGVGLEVRFPADGGDDIPPFGGELADRGSPHSGGGTGDDDRLGHMRLLKGNELVPVSLFWSS